MRPRSLSLLICLAIATFVTSAHAYTYGDTLTVIWRPLPNLPALARPGDAFRVWANAPSTAANWSASLRYGALEVPLAPTGGGWQATKGRWELSFSVPAGTPEEIYALILTSDSTLPDTAAHAVKVLPQYLDDYYFAQISDTHLPEHALSSNGTINVADTSGMGDFDAVINDLNVIHPQYIIHTGDLVNEGELEEYLGMYEMGRAQGMLNRLRDPIWVSSGNHDIGGWGATPPPDGNSRKDWWRYYGWPFLGNPPSGDPYHSQDFTFDYGPLHVIGLEAYINSGSYDHYMQNIWGAQSFTAEQMGWLSADIAAQPPGTHKLAFYHYDFGGTLANGTSGANYTQINPGALGLDGAIWGHYHTVPEGTLTPRTAQPFNLGCQSVIDYRAFRIFHVHNGVISPGPMHRAGGTSSAPTDSLSLAWTAPNDGTRSLLGATVVNRFGELFERSRLVFNMADHDSTFTATGGTLAQVLRQGGIASVYVDFTLPASGSAVLSVQTNAPVLNVPPAPVSALELRSVVPNPFHARAGSSVTVRFALPFTQRARMDIFDLDGRQVARLLDGPQPAGERIARWDGLTRSGRAALPGVYLVRLEAESGTRSTRLVLAR